MPAAGILAGKGANIGKLFCTAPKILKLRLFLELIRIIERKRHLRGPTPWPGGWGCAHTYWTRPLSPGPPGAPLPRGLSGGPLMPIFGYMESFVKEKIIS